MDTFRPSLSGLPPAFQSEAPPPAPLTQETIDVATTHTNAERIFDALRDAGGSMAGADLRAALADLDQPERAKAVGLLRSQGRIRSEGSTVQITYHLVDSKSAPTREQAERLQPAAPAEVLASTAHAASEANLSLELQFLACLEQMVEDPDFVPLSATAKLRGAEWLASRLRSQV